MNVLADQVFLLARRSVVRTIRQPANVIAPLLFPMMLLAVNSGGLKAETRLPARKAWMIEYCLDFSISMNFR